MSFPTSWMKTQALSTNVSHYFYSNVRVQLIFNVPIFTSKYHWTGNKTVFRDSQPTKNQNDQCWFYLASLSVGFGDAISRGKSKSCDQFMAVRIRMNTHDRIILTVDNWNSKGADPYLRSLVWMLPGPQCDSPSRRASGISCWMIDLGAHFASKIHRGALHYKF